MKEYLRREQLILAVNRIAQEHSREKSNYSRYNVGWSDACDRFMGVIKGTDLVDAARVVYGTWLEGYDGGGVVCSVCGEELHATTNENKHFCFCPNCGATMKDSGSDVTFRIGRRSMMNEKVARHKALCEELNDLYARKNHDYGDSFHLSYEEEGLAMARIRLGDKLSRFKTLSRLDKQEVTDESIRDTLIDLANYALMTIMELEEENHG